jgi:hypothetical protein
MATLAAALRAKAQTVTAQVLYPMQTPAGFTNTFDSGNPQTAADGQVVGYGFGPATGNNDNALLWSGPSGNAVNLNPTSLSDTYTESLAYGTNGAQQVGFALDSNLDQDQAMLWAGTAASAVDLNPTNLTGFTSSLAYGISGNGGQQVGVGGIGGVSHALLWSKTAGSAVDLNPTNLTGYTTSVAVGTNGSQQVGYGAGSGTGNNAHALLWTGTAASAVDLQKLLPSTGSWIYSEAYTIDSSGDIYGDAYGTYQSNTGYFAVEWTAVPEPASFCVLVSGGLLMLRRRVS